MPITDFSYFSSAGPKSEGNIICLPSNKRHRGARANYTLDPCVLSCYGNTFILRILRHSTSWYIWVWAYRQDDDNNSQRGVGGEHVTERFPFTIRFRHGASRSHSDTTPPVLTLSGFTVSLRLSMEEVTKIYMKEYIRAPEFCFLFFLSLLVFCSRLSLSFFVKLLYTPSALANQPIPGQSVCLSNCCCRAEENWERGFWKKPKPTLKVNAEWQGAVYGTVNTDCWRWCLLL